MNVGLKILILCYFYRTSISSVYNIAINIISFKIRDYTRLFFYLLNYLRFNLKNKSTVDTFQSSPSYR